MINANNHYRLVNIIQEFMLYSFTCRDGIAIVIDSKGPLLTDEQMFVINLLLV